MSETWKRDDGWVIEVYSREPLITSYTPLVNSVDNTYEDFCLAAQAQGYGLEGEN